jgi:hypothetical protein
VDSSFHLEHAHKRPGGEKARSQMRNENPDKRTLCKRTIFISILLFATVFLLSAYVLYPWYCRSETAQNEAVATLPGDEIVPKPKGGYTLAISINTSSVKVWPWLMQMGQGRAGFYTHEWIENLIGADIQNAQSIIPELQHLEVGDSVRLTPDPYLGGQPGQYIAVAQLQWPSALVFRQALPNGARGSWAFVLESAPEGTTRLIFRRRSSQPSLFDRIMAPGYYFMDMGMLSGIKKRSEGKA